MSTINHLITKVDELTLKEGVGAMDQSPDLNNNRYGDIFRGIMSQDAYKVQENLTKLRKLLSVDDTCTDTIKRIMEYPDIGNMIVKLSYMSQYPLLQQEAMWVITNMASTDVIEFNKYVINIGCLESLIQGMKSSHLQVASQAVWGVANIIGSSSECARMAIEIGLIPIIDILWSNHKSNEEIGAELSRVQSNVLNTSPPPSNDVVEACIPTLLEFLKSNHYETVYNAIWSISYIFNNNEQNGKIVYGTNDWYGIVKRILEFGENNRNDRKKLVPVVRSIGKIIFVISDSQTLNLINTHSSSLFSLFHHILVNRISKVLVNEVCWCISNIVVKSVFIDIVINNGILKLILDGKTLPTDPSILDDIDCYISNELFWIMANIFKCTTSQQFTLISREYNLFGFMMMWLDKRCKDVIGKKKLTSAAIERLINNINIYFEIYIKPNHTLFISVPNWKDVINQLIICGDQSISSGFTKFNDLIKLAP